MAPEKLTPVEQPPPADSSSEEEEEASNDEGEDSFSDESNEESPNREKKTVPHKENDGSDSGSDEAIFASDSLDLISKPVFVVQSQVESKLNESAAAPPAPAPALVSAVTTDKSSKKRSAETENDVSDLKRSKKVVGTEAPTTVVDEEVKKVGEESKKVGEDSKKQPFQRLFSEEDEIEILKGMWEFSAEKGINPSGDFNGFHDYVKKFIHINVTNTQLSGKIRKLRRKYIKNVSEGRETFAKQHDQVLYDLSKKLWVDSKVDEKEKPNASSFQIPKVVKNEDGCVRQVSSSASFCLTALAKNKDVMAMGLSEDFIRKGLDLIDDEVNAKMEVKWRDLCTAELELHYQCMELTREQLKLILDENNSSAP